jgi:hypothetical protein
VQLARPVQPAPQEFRPGQLRTPGKQDKHGDMHQARFAQLQRTGIEQRDAAQGTLTGRRLRPGEQQLIIGRPPHELVGRDFGICPFRQQQPLIIAALDNVADAAGLDLLACRHPCQRTEHRAKAQQLVANCLHQIRRKQAEPRRPRRQLRMQRHGVNAPASHCSASSSTGAAASSGT